MTAYLDSSVAMSYILNGESSIRHALACGRVVSSELFEIECRRVMHRCRMNGTLDDKTFVAALKLFEELLDSISLISLSGAAKKKAMGPFPVSVRTLDALHLACASVYSESLPDEALLIFSHDDVMNQCAAALGFSAPLSEVK